jgi:hypothetical protein
MRLWPESHPNLLILRQIMSHLCTYVLLALLRTFVNRFDSPMTAKFAQAAMVCAVPTSIFLLGGLSPIQYLVIMPFLSFRFNGTYALNITLSSGTATYKHDAMLYRWLVALAWGFFLCSPLPLTFLINKLDAVRTLSWLQQWHVQDALPYAFCVQVLYRNGQDLRKALPALRARRSSLSAPPLGPGADAETEADGEPEVEDVDGDEVVLQRRERERRASQPVPRHQPLNPRGSRSSSGSGSGSGSVSVSSTKASPRSPPSRVRDQDLDAGMGGMGRMSLSDRRRDKDRRAR